MKTKKLGLISAIVLTMVFLFALNASAGWYSCTIDLAGIGGSNIAVRLTDDNGTFTNRGFFLEKIRENEMLAVALTAVSNGMHVSVNLSDSAEWSTITCMYLKP